MMDYNTKYDYEQNDIKMLLYREWFENCKSPKGPCEKDFYRTYISGKDAPVKEEDFYAVLCENERPAFFAGVRACATALCGLGVLKSDNDE